jgi:N-acetylglucosaminyldiphosphoundecaprenol N-acetyl-beta-D-mannosaminyltransferase
LKIAYFVNSFGAINWGGQATSNGIQHLIEKFYPNAEFIPLDLPFLPFRKIKIARSLLDKMLYGALMSDDAQKVYKMLRWYKIDENYFVKYTHICFNGEGAIHTKSGHLILLMALLYLAKKKGLIVAAVNQTIDLKKSPKLEKLVKMIYDKVDFVSVREPVSLEYVQSIGIKKAKLIPDAAYGLPKISKAKIDEIAQAYNLPKEFIGIAGSSILQRDNKSVQKVERTLQMTQKRFALPIVFFANAKTDIYIAHKLQKKYDFLLIEPPVKYIDATALIAKCTLLISGRQHPNIFAYEYGVPYIPFSANTVKNIGVAKLQNYPIAPLSWDCSYDEFCKVIDTVSKTDIVFDRVKIDDFKIFGDL